MRFVIESHYSEIFSLRIIGASIGQISINLIFQMQVLIVISSFFGLLFGTTLTFLIPNFQNIDLVGFFVGPKFSLDFFIISLLTISIFSFFILVYSLLKVDWKHPIEVMENLQQRNN